MFPYKESTLYVRVYLNRITVRSLDLDKLIDRTSPQPFSTTRLLVGDFITAESFLRALIKEFYPNSLFPLRIRILFQPMEKSEGGLSSVELRTLRDLGEQAGGVVVKIYEGDRLLPDFEVRDIISSDDHN